MTALSVLLAVLLDIKFGDPSPHPIIYFGKAISWAEKRFNRGQYKTLKGGLVTLALVLATFTVTAVLLMLAFVVSPWLALLLNTLGVFYFLAFKTLMQEGRWVFEALDQQGLDAGRQQVARIVGRNTSELTDQQVKKATLETIAENLSDGVLAPLFWFALLGLPGMAAYKMINTLDSMIGYKSERYKQFGFVAAKLDDIANWVPARITAMLLAGINKKAWQYIRRYGNQHASPNAGYPEAALAGILNCRFGGPNKYFGQLIDKPYIGEQERRLDMQDYTRTYRICKIAYGAGLLMVLASVFF